MKNFTLGKQILVAIVIGLAIGFISPSLAASISPLGDVFLRLLRMLIVPLVFFSITSGICKMGNLKQLRTVGFRFGMWIVISALLASAVGVALGLIVQPGAGTTEFLATGIEAEAVEYSFIDNMVTWVPNNIVEAMANAEMLQIIFFCFLLGVALLSLGKKASGFISLIHQGSDIMLKITDYVIRFSPLGILALMARMVSTISGAMMREVVVFLVVDIVAVLLIVLLIFPLFIKFFIKINPLKFYSRISPAILVAASTTSSAATLPVSLKLSEEKLGISENIYGFALPLGNTTGMAGFALFVGLCSVFASNLYGFDITFVSILQFVFLGMILSIGAAGVKGAGIVMSTVLLQSLGMPLTLIPILAAVWPVIDVGHTVLNNVGDLVGTTMVAKSLDKMDMDTFEGEKEAVLNS